MVPSASSGAAAVARAAQAVARRLAAQAPRVAKPWFVYRPRQVLRRARTIVSAPTPGYRRLKTSWGVFLFADPTRDVGRSILTTGVYDLAVSELLARLVEPGDTAIDADAHIGYMTVLAAVAAGPRGRVLSFEPHTERYALADENVHAAREQCQMAPVELHNGALGEGDDALDGVLGNVSARVLNLRGEESALPALRGARRALESHRIANVVFDDPDVEGSDVLPFLRAFGYHVYSVGWSVRGLSLRPVAHERDRRTSEAPSFLASVEPGHAFSRCRARGFRVLGDDLIRREQARDW
jgi:FkbM family methyltransferase